MTAVKRLLAAVILLSAVAAGTYAVGATRREHEFRRLVDAGDAALARQDMVGAIAAFSDAIGLKRDSMLGYLKRGEAYRRRNELDTALPDLRRAADLDPLAPRPLELLGDVNYALKRFTRAAEYYQRYLRLDDRSARLQYKLGVADYAAGQWGLAVKPLQRAVDLDDRFADAYYLLGLCLRDLQRPEESRRALDRAVKLAPALLQAREELGDLYGRMGRSEDSITQLEALRGLDPGPTREVALAMAYERAGQTENAVLTLGRAANRYPDYSKSYVALGRLWFERARTNGDRVDLSKALGALEAAIANDDSSEALSLYGRALLLAREDGHAEQVLVRATTVLPVDSLAFFALAEAAGRLGHAAVARRALLDYHALEGDDPDEHAAVELAIRIADLSMKIGDNVSAVAWYEHAIGSSDGDIPTLIRLAQAQLLAGLQDAARVTLTRVLEKDPANRTAQNLLRRLG